MNQLTPKALTKRAIAEAGTKYARKILDDGEISPLIGYIKLNALKGAIDKAISELKSEAINEADMYGRDDSIVGNVTFSVRSGRTYYDYGEDSAWNEMKADEKDAANKRKAREGFLRALTDEMVDPHTGEFVKPAQISKYGARVLAITFPK